MTLLDFFWNQPVTVPPPGGGDGHGGGWTRGGGGKPLCCTVQSLLLLVTFTLLCFVPFPFFAVCNFCYCIANALRGTARQCTSKKDTGRAGARCGPARVKSWCAVARAVASVSLYSAMPAHRHARWCLAKTPLGPLCHRIGVSFAPFPRSTQPPPPFLALGAFAAGFALGHSPWCIVLCYLFAVLRLQRTALLSWVALDWWHC